MIVNLPEDKVDAVLQGGAALCSLDDAALDSLVAANKLSANDAKDLGLTASLYRVLDENVALTEALKKGTITAIPGNKLTDIHDLVHLDQSRWNKILGDNEGGANLEPVTLCHDQTHFRRLSVDRGQRPSRIHDEFVRGLMLAREM